MPEAYIRGNTIKYLRVPDEVIDKVRDDSYNRAGSMGAAQHQLHQSRGYSLVLAHATSVQEADLICNRSCRLINCQVD